MKKIHTFNLSEAPLAEMFRRILLVEGIDTVIRNDRLRSALGEIPFVECYPELWVLEDEQADRAREILQAYLAAPPGEAWTCPACGAEVNGELAACWRCGRSAPTD